MYKMTLYSGKTSFLINDTNTAFTKLILSILLQYRQDIDEVVTFGWGVD